MPGRPDNDPRYQLVFQYRLFYPYNDAGNIHEGDWEHINIVVTTTEQAAEPFTGAQMEALVSGMTPPDQLIIREVQYYFHHWVFKVDYFLPNVYLPREEWEKQVESIEPDLEKALDAFLSGHQGQPMRIFCTYTAMMSLRRVLAARYDLPGIGEEAS